MTIFIKGFYSDRNIFIVIKNAHQNTFANYCWTIKHWLEQKVLDFFLKSVAMHTAGRFPYNFNVYNESNCFVVNTVKTAIVSINLQFV